MAKPWFQVELERVTREKWRVTTEDTRTSLRCTHGMKIWMANPPGQPRPFLNRDQERHFVGKVLPAHRPFEEVKIPWAELVNSW